MRHFPVKAEELERYAEYVNNVLADSVCIFSDAGGIVTYADATAELSWGENGPHRENFELLFADETVYGDCDTVAEKVEVFNRRQKEKWFADGEIPEMPEEFKGLMADLMEEIRPQMTLFETLLDPDRSGWFAAYNGEKLQVVEPEEEYTAGWPLSYPGKIYYRAEAGESPEDVVKYMTAALLEHLEAVSQKQDMVITDYRLEEQELISWEDIVETYTNNCWMDYLNQFGKVTENLMHYGREWIGKRVSGNDVSMRAVGLQEDMWYFFLRGYYRYNGGIPTFADRASWGGCE